MNLKELKHAVQHLSNEDFKTFEVWFDNVRTQKWAEDIEATTRGGKLNKMAEQALSDFRKGHCSVSGFS
jgi:hypothetical protein